MSQRIKKLCNKRLLATLLGTSLETLERITANPDNHYRLRKVGKKPREAEVPFGELKLIQAKIKDLLNELPSRPYRHCGTKKRSYKTNAQAHVGAQYFGSMDIKSYYKNSTREHVFRFLHFKLEISEDVAWMITDLVTYKGFIPTGSPSSQVIAFWSHVDIFDKINQEVEAAGNTFTLYVDDMGFSSTGSKLNPKLHLQIAEILKQSNLRLKRSKVTYSKETRTGFEITGAVVGTKGELQPPHRLKRKLFSGLDEVGRDIKKLKGKNFQSLIGTLRSIRSVEPGSFPALYHKFRLREKELHKATLQQTALQKTWV